MIKKEKRTFYVILLSIIWVFFVISITYISGSYSNVCIGKYDTRGQKCYSTAKTNIETEYNPYALVTQKADENISNDFSHFFNKTNIVLIPLITLLFIVGLYLIYKPQK